MRYYELFDDMSIPGRWHLGEMTDLSGHAVDLDLARALPHEQLRCPISDEGEALDYSLTSFNAPVARAHLAAALEDAANGDIQRVDLLVAGRAGFEGINVLRVVDCLDESRSRYAKWTADDHRGDLAGQYRSVTRLRVDPSRVPSDAHIFRLDRWLVAVVVSEVMKSAMERVGCTGATFTEVT